MKQTLIVMDPSHYTLRRHALACAHLLGARHDSSNELLQRSDNWLAHRLTMKDKTCCFLTDPLLFSTAYNHHPYA